MIDTIIFGAIIGGGIYVMALMGLTAAAYKYHGINMRPAGDPHG